MNRLPRPAYIRRMIIRKSLSPRDTFTLEEVHEVLSHYDLGAWRLGKLLGGGNSDNIILHTQHGKKVLKRYRWPLPHPLVEQSYYWHLAARRFPVPALIPNQDGQTYTDVSGRIYSIFDFVDGYILDDYFLWPTARVRLIERASESFAQFHQLVDGFVPSGEKYDGFVPGSRRLFRDVDWHIEVLERYRGTVMHGAWPDALDVLMMTILDDLKRDLVVVGRHYTEPDPNLAVVATHGDYRPGNVLFRNGRVAAVLDFSGACINLRALDVARAIGSFAQAGRYGISGPLAAAFLAAYQSQHPLTASELCAIPDLLRWRHLGNIVHKIHALEAHPQYASRRTLPDFVRRKWLENGWLKANRDWLQGIFKSATRAALAG